MQLSAEKMKVNVIIPCGGRGQRCGFSHNKLLEPLIGEPLIFHTLTPILANQEVSHVVLACSAKDIAIFDEIVRRIGDDRLTTVLGGDTRAHSVYNALQALSVSSDNDIVLVHDGARPFLSDQLLADIITATVIGGSAVAAIPITDTIAQVDSEHNIIGHVERTTSYRLQTPQGFMLADLATAYTAAYKDNNLGNYTDESSIMIAHGYKARVVEGDENNIKLTFNTDFQRVIGADYRIGVGYDTHELVEGRELWLGGIKIAHTKGLLGHSDADVLIHAIMDSLLSAMDMRDIGVLFPDNDSTFKGIDSKVLLAQVAKHMQSKKIDVVNISCVVMAQKPKLMPHIPAMRATIAQVLGIQPTKVRIAATTTEGLGFIGREEGIAARSIALCRHKLT